MYNFVFSTTRQWNPGDEIILKGILNILEEMGIDFNPIIFNRNPDIRTGNGAKIYRGVASEKDTSSTLIRSALWENSMKPWNSYNHVDAVFFAGTPEWQGWRTHELFLRVIENNIPSFFVGVDGEYLYENYASDSVVRNARYFSTRNEAMLPQIKEAGIDAIYRTCPSILSSKKEKNIDDVKCIGLIYRGKEGNVTHYNEWTEQDYHSQIEEYKRIIAKFGDRVNFVIICHFIDELELAINDFPEIDEIRYSFDSDDYFNIYSRCDLVIGSRIHGIG